MPPTERGVDELDIMMDLGGLSSVRYNGESERVEDCGIVDEEIRRGCLEEVGWLVGVRDEDGPSKDALRSASLSAYTRPVLANSLITDCIPRGPEDVLDVVPVWFGTRYRG